MRLRLGIVIGLAALVVAIYGGLILLWLGSSQIFASAPGGSSELMTALKAHELAEKVARAWKGDAVLTSASCAWTNPTEAELLEGKMAWGFNFVSPSSAEVQTISVFKGRAGALKTDRAISIPNALSVVGWKVDSPKALSIFLDNGGRDFLVAGHPDTNVHMHLSTRAENERLLWTVSALSAASGSYISVQVDATSGQVVETLQG
jgi:hypothetical protein